MNAFQVNNMPNFKRRALLVGTLSMAAAPAMAIAPIWILVGPTVLAGLLGIIGVRMQLRANEQQHAEQMRLNQANLEIARAQLASQDRTARRQEEVAILTALLNKSEALADRYVQGLLTRQSLAFDVDGSNTTALLSENIDNRGTRLGLSQGILALERGRTAARVNNQNALDMGRTANRDGDAVPVPVSGRLYDLDAKLSALLREKFSREKALTDQEVEQGYTLASVQAFSRARSPRAGGPDVYAAAFNPKDGRSTQYTYLYDRKVG